MLPKCFFCASRTLLALIFSYSFLTAINADASLKYDVQCKANFQINPDNQTQALCDDGLNQYDCQAANCHDTNANSKPINDCQPLEKRSIDEPQRVHPETDKADAENEKAVIIPWKRLKQGGAAPGGAPRGNPHSVPRPVRTRPDYPLPSTKVRSNHVRKPPLAPRSYPHGANKIPCSHKDNKQNDIQTGR
ncbi:hypothetical protein O181_084775 [Austropuccinia psidii MF-1]|uniref:Uncharacterized protein n=1 Tax=Austropuccinia psidii MF-1 TaxID=1389203 RepID=A0A9Q3FW98_9BASI|nr:hypothetical protein [Austropuccinia psidii MF-1]